MTSKLLSARGLFLPFQATTAMTGPTRTDYFRNVAPLADLTRYALVRDRA